MITYAMRLTAFCPMHRRPANRRKGFRCICVELNQAFNLGLRATRERRRG